MRRIAVLGLISAFALFFGIARNTNHWQQRRTTSEVSFSRDLFPIIKKYCIVCHSRENDHPSELFLESYNDVMGEGRHGKAVVPGSAERSILYQKLLPNPPFGRMMPPSRRIRLTPQQIELFKRWIDQGAKNN